MRRYTEQEDTKPHTMTSKLSAISAMIPKRRALGDITNAYSEETKDSTVIAKKPQFVHHQPVAGPSKAEAVEQNEMQQISNRPYMDRLCDDIDARDTDNPLLVTCYVNELYDNYNELEKAFKVNPMYMSRQDYVNEKMRTILVDWLVRTTLIACCSIDLLLFISLYRWKCTSSLRWFRNPCTQP